MNMTVAATVAGLMLGSGWAMLAFIFVKVMGYMD